MGKGGVEHLWIRLADLREEAADEEWEARNPRWARFRTSFRYWRAQFKLALKWVSEREQTQLWLIRCRHGRECVEHRALQLYLVLTRCGCKPLRRLISQLSTKDLLLELGARGLDDRTDLLERDDLLDALCGPRPAPAATSDFDLDDAPTTLDKMV